MHKFNQLFYLLMEDITSNFNEKFCYIIGKSKLIQPNDEILQCIYIDKHLLSSINRFYGFAKTCWHSFHPHKISKFHLNEQIRSLENESINN